VPELPEVERVRLSLAPRITGRRIGAAVLHRRDIAESFRGSQTPIRTRTTPEALLQGDTVGSLLRHGKQLAIVGRSGRVLLVHLGMSGQLLWKAPDAPIHGGHVHAEWHVTDSRGRSSGRVVFRDPRRFGGLWTFESVEALRNARWSRLGPDALTITGDQLREGLGRTRRSIKAALLDQEVIAGVGNIYADEALFLAGIRPKRRAGALKTAEIDRLVGTIREVLQRSIETGGSTLRDYVDADGAKGGAQEWHAVYGRGGEACRVCGGELRHGLVAQRTTVWCPRCQG
jgi:formamidopyrimidine-DNA glycosylase